MFWLSRITEHSHYASGLLGPMMVTATGLGLIFVPLSLIALTKVANNDAGVALQPAQHRPAGRRGARSGGARHGGVERGGQQPPFAGGRGGRGGEDGYRAPVRGPAGRAAEGDRPTTPTAIGFSKGYLVSAGIALLALIITLVAIRVKREDLAGVNPMAAPVD